MEKPCFQITTSPESEPLLYTQNISKRQTGHLTSLASHHSDHADLFIRHGQHDCSTWAKQSRMSSHLGSCELAIGRDLGTDAGAISGVDGSAALVLW